jgi:hypothetical protein
MSLGAEVDAEVDLGPLVFELMGGIKASLDGLTAAIKRTRQIEEAYQFGAREIALRGASTSDSGGDTLIIDLGGPSYARVWQTRRLVIGGSTWTATVAGSALVVVSANQPSSSGVPISDIGDEVGTLPSNGFYSTGQLIVRHPNHLFVVILTPTAATNYGVGGAATDLPDSRVPITVPE